MFSRTCLQNRVSHVAVTVVLCAAGWTAVATAENAWRSAVESPGRGRGLAERVWQPMANVPPGRALGVVRLQSQCAARGVPLEARMADEGAQGGENVLSGERVESVAAVNTNYDNWTNPPSELLGIAQVGGDEIADDLTLVNHPGLLDDVGFSVANANAPGRLTGGEGVVRFYRLDDGQFLGGRNFVLPALDLAANQSVRLTLGTGSLAGMGLFLPATGVYVSIQYTAATFDGGGSLDNVGLQIRGPAGTGASADELIDVTANMPFSFGGHPPADMAMLIKSSDLPDLPPVCDAGGPYAVECDGPFTRIALDGTGSSDPSGTELTYAWSSDCPDASFDDASSPTPALAVAGGCNLNCHVMLTVSDGVNWASGSAWVSVADTTAPVIASKSLAILWPADGLYRSLTLADCVQSVTDQCGGAMNVNAVGRIISIYSDEPEDAAGKSDGSTQNDIVIQSATSFQLRAELEKQTSSRRKRMGAGRVYGVTFEVADPCGNTARATAYFGVPKNWPGPLPEDDGVGDGYGVMP